MSAVLGMNASLEIQTDGVGGSAGWNVVQRVRDASLGLERSEADLSHRGNNGWRATVATLAEGTVEGELVYDTADTEFESIRDAFLNNTILGVRFLDGPSPGGQGLEADMIVTAFGIDQPLEEGVTVSFTMKPTDSTTPPAWVITS